jgi:hypothetical protein
MNEAHLRLVREEPVGKLLPPGSPSRLEASGVLATDRHYYVIFDNLRAVAVIDQDLDHTDDNLTVPVAPGPHDDAYEDIARDSLTGHLYLLIEAMRRGDEYQARVEEYDHQLGYVSTRWLEFPLPSLNKGIEGLACVDRGGETFLLGLCEGNRARDGAAGRRPGGGRVAVFQRGRHNWTHETTIKLPETLAFEDYSSLSVEGDRVAVASQQSSALWLGRLDPAGWELAEPGSTYLFPRDAHDNIMYGTVEGICWLGSGQFVAVSDRVTRTSGDTLTRAKEESLHVFALPAGDPRTIS